MKMKFKPHKKIKALRDVLITKRGGRHEEKDGKRIKRARAKRKFQKELKEMLND